MICKNPKTIVASNAIIVSRRKTSSTNPPPKNVMR
jgi:hypothetical protein